MTKKYASLVGMFYIVDNDDASTYQTGEIISEIADGGYFVRVDGKDHPMPLEIMFLSDMTECSTGGSPLWSFFHTREERQAWIDYVDAPSGPKVVSMVKK